MNLDTKSVIGPAGATLSGDQAARLLDLAGVVANRNTIPGDRSALNPSGSPVERSGVDSPRAFNKKAGCPAAA